MAAAPGSRNRSPSTAVDLSLVSDQLHEPCSHEPSSPSAVATSDEELRSFILEVSARRAASLSVCPSNAAVAPALSSGGESPPAEPDPEREPTLPLAEEAAQEELNHDAAIVETPILEPLTRELSKVARRSTAKRRSPAAPSQLPSTDAPPVFTPVDAPTRRRSLPAWFASLSVHVTMLVLLATVSLATIKPPPPLEMHFAPAAIEEVQFDEVAVEDVVGDVGALVASETPAELIDPGAMAFGGFAGEAEIGTGLEEALGGTAPAGTPGGGGDLGEIGSMFGSGEGQGTGEFGTGLGGAPTAKFFGAEIAGRRIVFVLDNSGSMQGGRLETVIAELLNCLDRLNEDQEFYIIFHSDAVYPMLYPDPIDRYVRPTEGNKRMVKEWLDTVELCLGDSVEEAIIAAASIDPDTVFLLSDGRIQGENKFRVLLNGESRNFPIHTFAVGMNGSVTGRKNLQMIADANGGSFTESEISPEMRDLSRRNLRPYHNKSPGPVWGRQVKPFKFGR